MKIEDFKLAYELIDVLMQTKEWEEIRRSDPRIQDGKARLQAAIANISDNVSAELLDAIEAAAFDLQDASADAATLYGMRTANVIQDVLNNPMLFSQMFLDRTEKCSV